MERSQRRWIECGLLKVLQQIMVACIAHQPCSPLFYSKYSCHAAEKWKYFVSLMLRISPLPSSMQSPPIFIILLHLSFWQCSLKASCHQWGLVRAKSPVAAVQPAGRCAGGGRCPSPCSVLVNIRRDIKCQARFTRKLSNLFGLDLILTWRTGLH